ncbi:MAG: hypothetical protein JNK23_10660 [Opitutaceae bacterium]|nr:hypothetical protein [Opitutaceae bacterium]
MISAVSALTAPLSAVRHRTTGAALLGQKRTARILAAVAEADAFVAAHPASLELRDQCCIVRGAASLVLGPQLYRERRKIPARLALLERALARMQRLSAPPAPACPAPAAAHALAA